MAYAPILSLFDAVVYNILGSEKRNEYGKQRLWANMSLALFAVLSGYIIDNAKADTEADQFHISFYIYGIFLLILSCIMFVVKIENVKPNGSVFRGMVTMLHDRRILVFLVVVAVTGFFSGSIEAFLFWFLETELNNNLKIIPGLCMLSNCLSEILIFYFAGRIIKTIGHLNSLYIACFAYFVRFISYSFLTNVWFVLPIELLNGITFSLMWTAVTSYGSIIAPRGMSGTIQGLLHGLHYGFGKHLH
ncbi:unnamed protein product [Mytilus coruscus]|uniref:Major facilitator superfamily associated domain-containing protein n=1 Tax=Mytilus coruscus TaxID=42192 RepID=A0A6J8CX89_MYTCO|nr:unnamed protein product [Mytilus coruscus]